MDTFQTEWLHVVIAAIVSMGMGALWYSKWLFGSIKEKNKKRKQVPIFWGFCVALFTAYFLSLFEGYLGVTDVTDGMYVGFLLWIGFSATTDIAPVIWSKKPFQHFLIDAGFKLFSFLVMGGLIAA